MHLVMDYVEWEDLSVFIKKGHRFTKENIAEILV